MKTSSDLSFKLSSASVMPSEAIFVSVVIMMYFIDCKAFALFCLEGIGLTFSPQGF